MEQLKLKECVKKFISYEDEIKNYKFLDEIILNEDKKNKSCDIYVGEIEYMDEYNEINTSAFEISVNKETKLMKCNWLR